ncbi:MAG: helix-turn-helix transcriptional regulator [Bacillota bacterium]
MNVDLSTIKIVQNRFKLLRQAANWTSQQVADELGITRQTVACIEGHKAPLTKSNCIAFLAILEHRSKEVPDLMDIVRVVIDRNRKQHNIFS